jgi:transcription termination factor Rho
MRGRRPKVGMIGRGKEGGRRGGGRGREPSRSMRGRLTLEKEEGMRERGERRERGDRFRITPPREGGREGEGERGREREENIPTPPHTLRVSREGGKEGRERDRERERERESSPSSHEQCAPASGTREAASSPRTARTGPGPVLWQTRLGPGLDRARARARDP